MNGDVNGIMTEPIDVSLNKSDQTKVTPEDCDESTNSHVTSNTNDPEYSEEKNCSLKNGVNKIGQMEVTKSSADENSNDVEDKSCLEFESTTDSQDPNQGASDNCTIENHSDTSNGSDSMSTNSHTEFKIVCTQDQKVDSDTIQDNGQIEDMNEETIFNEDSDDDSNGDDSIVSVEHRVEDTVSINSDSENESEDEILEDGENKINDIVILDTENRRANTSRVHEIVSDIENDVSVIAREEKADSNHSKEKVQLRRSSRTIKRKRYDDAIENGGESDIEELEYPSSQRRKAKPIVINDTKTLVAMAAKQMRATHGGSQRKEPTVVIIDTNSGTTGKISFQHKQNSTASMMNSSISAQNLYQSIVARGTTVTPISSKNSTSQSVPNQQPIILPSLTDDMFVVEAPSFIVPYVYEKPSIKPFREFVDKLGKELEEEKIKEDKATKEINDKIKEAIKDEDRAHSDEDDKVDSKELEDMKKQQKRGQKRRRNDEDDASWDGESLSDSDEALSDDDDKIVVKDKTETIDQINVVSDLTADSIISSKANGLSSMDCSLGKFFINIGLNLVQEFVQNDLLKQQNRKLNKEKKGGHSTKATESSITQLMKNLEFSKENNAPYSFPQNKCEFCSFKTESKLVMAQHLETPHMKNNVYKCNFCTFEIRSPHDILYHMEAEHNVRGKLERAPSYHQCSNCPFEDNGKGKLARHLIACAKKFKPDTNLAPPVDWEPPAKIPKIARPRNSITGPYQNSFNRGQIGTNIRGPMNLGGLVTTMNTGFRARGRSPMGIPPRNPPIHGLPIMRGPSMLRPNVPSTANMSNYPIVNNTKPKSMHQPSISITPLPRQPQPSQQTQTINSANNKGTFVICEICDGYIKDLEQLRNHMQWIHKVKIHPKMIYNRPPLNCQKCQFRFFTDQGLERHLLGSHGLVTSSMQEAANKGKDAGRCPVCGRVYQWKLLHHVARDHNLTLKPAHLSYKCTVCTATFGMYKQFENHVYSAHSVVAKRVMDKNKTSTAPPTKNNSDTLLKPLKINDEITIVPQSVKAATSAKEK